MYENLKDTLISGRFKIKTKPIAVTKFSIVFACNALDQSTQNEVTIILDTLNENEHKQLFDLAEKSLHVLHAGTCLVTQTSTSYFIVLEKLESDVLLVEFESEILRKRGLSKDEESTALPNTSSSGKPSIHSDPPEPSKWVLVIIAIFICSLIAVISIVIILNMPLIPPIHPTHTRLPTNIVKPTHTITPTHIIN